MSEKTAEQEAKRRKAFEQKHRSMQLQKDENGSMYRDHYVNNLWWTWNAACEWSAAQAKQWLPIESAPRDGTLILLHHYAQAVEGRYSRSEILGHMGSRRVQIWQTAAGPIYENEPQPTHWMPRPTPPEQPSSGGSDA